MAGRPTGRPEVDLLARSWARLLMVTQSVLAVIVLGLGIYNLDIGQGRGIPLLLVGGIMVVGMARSARRLWGLGRALRNG